MAIEFIGDGDASSLPGEYHADGCIDDHTLCGITLDGDKKTAGAFRIVNEKINCEICVHIIKHCIPLRKQI